MCRLSRNSGASTSWNSKGLSRPVAGKLYLFFYLFFTRKDDTDRQTDKQEIVRMSNVWFLVKLCAGKHHRSTNRCSRVSEVKEEIFWSWYTEKHKMRPVKWPTQPPIQRVTGRFPGVKRPGRGVNHPPPPSAEDKERVELYFYSLSGPSWPLTGWTLPLPFYLFTLHINDFSLLSVVNDLSGFTFDSYRFLLSMFSFCYRLLSIIIYYRLVSITIGPTDSLISRALCKVSWSEQTQIVPAKLTQVFMLPMYDASHVRCFPCTPFVLSVFSVNTAVVLPGCMVLRRCINIAVWATCVSKNCTVLEGPEGEYRYNSALSLTSALDGGEWLTPHPGRSTPGKETRYSQHTWVGGPQGRSGRVWNTSPPPGFDPRTVQPVASRYTDWAIAAHVF